MKEVNGLCRQKQVEETDEEVDDEHNYSSSPSQPLDSSGSTLTRRYPTRDRT